jgi:diguanylate cyclase (GGDEF)-like protein
VDVDYFKRFNDQYGHQAGDACLKAIAKALVQSLRRPYDKVARYGGEEFACLLPNTDLLGAQSIAQRMVDQVRALAIEHLPSGVDPNVSISVGVAALDAAAEHASPTDLLKAADLALYEAKRAGRARIACAPGAAGAAVE